MKSSALTRKTPLRQKAIKPESGILRTAQLPAKAAPRQKRLKSSRPKMTPIRKSARGEDCTMRIVGICNQDPATTVWAHSNQSQDGKGMGIKARDVEGCYACSACHEFYDGGYARYGAARCLAQAIFDMARIASQAILKQKGLMP